MSVFSTNEAIQSYLLREKRSVALSAASGKPTPETARLVLAVQTDLAQFGLALDGAVLAELRRMDDGELVRAHKTLVRAARAAVGAHVRYQPLFCDFPNDVPDDESYLLRRMHGVLETYFNLATDEHTALSCGHVINHRLFDLNKFGACPVCQQQVPELTGTESLQVEDLAELTPTKLLGLMTDAQVWAALDNVARARTSLSASQKAFAKAVVQSAPAEAARRLPSAMPFKENAALVLGLLLRAGCTDPALFAHVKTPTDVLRVAVALCDGDCSLKETTRFKLSNAHRRFLMQAFEALPQNAAHLQEDMLRWRGRWLRLGEVLHVGAFKRQCPKLAECFDVLRNLEGSITTHASRVEQLLNGGRLDQPSQAKSMLALLKERPGEFARKVDVLLQRALPATDVVGAFEDVVSQVSTNILLTLLTHLRQRGAPAEFRAFMPKGSTAKMHIVEGDCRPPLADDARLTLANVARSELLRRFGAREPLGKVYVSEALADVVVPFSQRSASSSMAPMTRGSRICFDASKGFLRLFLNWKETESSGRIDVDLTCGLYRGDWTYMDHLSWTNLCSAGRSSHSGDVQSGSGPDGAAEFIDLDLAALKKRGVRYASVTVYSYTGQKFCDFPCFAGFMERQEPGKGRHFEAKTVVNKFDITGERMAMVPMFVDLESGQVVWSDLGLKTGRFASIERNGSRVVQQHKAVLGLRDARVSLKELFELHAASRGELVAKAEDADVVLDERKLFELDDVVANWL